MVFAMATIFVMALMTSTVGECKLVPSEKTLKEKGKNASYVEEIFKDKS